MTSRCYQPDGFSGSDSDSDGLEVVSVSTPNHHFPSSPPPPSSNVGGVGLSHSSVSQAHGSSQGAQFQVQGDDGHQYTFTPQQSIGRGRGRGRGRGQIVGWSSSQAQPSNCPAVGSSSVERLQEEKDRKSAIVAKITTLQQDTGAAFLQLEYAMNVANMLKSAWDSRDKHFPVVITEAFRNCMAEGWNIWALGLFCAVNASDFSFRQMGFQSTAVISGLRNFINSEKLPKTPVNKIQGVAMEVALCQKKMTDLKIFVEVFDLVTSEQKKLFLPNILKMCSNKYFREACQCATFLQLQDQFDIHAFLIPLLIQDRYNLVEDCIQNSPELQENVVKYFDSTFVDGHFQDHILMDYITTNKIQDVKMDKMSHKPISKLVKRLVARFNISPNCYPNVGHRQRFGELRFLFARRYDKNEMSVESFEELVNQIAEGSSKMKEEVLSHYMMYADFESAAKFIILNELYTSTACLNHSILPLLPEPHRSLLDNSYSTGSKIEENWDDEDDVHDKKNENSVSLDDQRNVTSSNMVASGTPPAWDEHKDQNDVPEVKQVQSPRNYYRCHLSTDCVQIISSQESFLELCEWLNDIQPDGDSEYILSGFDSEWKPIMSRRHGVALLQLAFEKKIFIVDVVTLKQNSGQDSFYWTNLRKSYFENERILKLGFDVKNDVKMLTETIHEWEELNHDWKSVLDLSNLKSTILREDPLFFKANDAVGEAGLSELVSHCLGKSLSKTEQMSDWEKRPLRESQIQYAADDAYCLIEVFKALEEIAKSSRVDLNKMIGSYLKGLGAPGASSAKKVKLGCVTTVLELLSSMAEDEDTSSNPQDSGSVKFVVDNMLQGLGRYLRALGFDTVILNNNQPHYMCCQYAKNNRKVITKGIAYHEIVSVTEEDMVYKVKSDQILDQLQEICNFFNIKLHHSRLFVICQRCNRSEFIKLSKGKMMELFRTSGMSKRLKVDCFNLSTFKGTAPDDMILCVKDITKDWKLLVKEDLFVKDAFTIVTKQDLPVELNKLQSFAHVIDWLYICNHCGKCYWESLQIENLIKESLEKVLPAKEVPPQ